MSAENAIHPINQKETKRAFSDKFKELVSNIKSDVVVAKNYLTQNEVEELGRIVNAYLELAESRAKRRIPMTMEDWATYLDKILTIDDRELLTRASEISAEIAQAKAIGEYEKFRVRQELEYKNDFDRQLDLLEEQARQANGGDAEGKN